MSLGSVEREQQERRESSLLQFVKRRSGAAPELLGCGQRGGERLGREAEPRRCSELHTLLLQPALPGAVSPPVAEVPAPAGEVPAPARGHAAPVQRGQPLLLPPHLPRHLSLQILDPNPAVPSFRSRSGDAAGLELCAR